MKIISIINYKTKEVVDINANFKEDNKNIKIAMFDYSKEEDNVYLIELLRSKSKLSFLISG